MTEQLEGTSLNQKLLAGRTVEERDGYVYVSYPRNLCSKDTAWRHLVRHPPKSVGRSRRPHGQDNPWVKQHRDNAWVWSAYERGAAIARAEAEARDDLHPEAK
jgi:hypothetical protein